MSSFQDILGENINVFSEDQRKERWQQWIDFNHTEGQLIQLKKYFYEIRKINDKVKILRYK